MKNKNKQTKFPVARIKRIMQKDEEVGKVAQATPVVISKALELFLGVIVDEASKVTIERGSKKVEAYHLKHAVETVETLDFLKEIVAAVPDPSAGGTVDLAADAAAKKRSKGKKTDSGAGEDGSGSGGAAEKPPPRRRRRKDDGEVVKGKGRGRGRAAAANAKTEEAMDEDRPVGREEDDDYEDEGVGVQGRAHDDDEDWEG